MLKIIISLAFLFLMGQSSFASYISLETNVTIEIKNNLVLVKVAAQNKGDEPAHNVQAEISLADKKFMAPKEREVGVNKIYQAERSFDLSKLGPGEYPVIMVLHYADANLYPFSALTCRTFNYKIEPQPAELFGAFKPISFSKKGKVIIELKNSSDSAVKTITALLVPQELSVAEKYLALELAARAVDKITFSVTNFSALAGSTYQVYAIAEYEKEGRHHTTVIPGIIRIVEDREIFGLSYALILGIVVFIFLVFIGAQFIKKK